jgi:hypothetical protein
MIELAQTVEQFMADNGIMQITHCQTPPPFSDITLPRSYSAVLVGGRWLHGATIADILEQI